MSDNGGNTRVRLEDVINYAPEQYMTDAELTVIRATFKDNPFLLNALRKILVPTIYDAQMPIEQFGADFFNAGRDWAAIPAEEAKILAVARQDAFQFVIGGLIKLKTLAQMPQETPDEASARQKKDSAQ